MCAIGSRGEFLRIGTRVYIYLPDLEHEVRTVIPEAGAL